MVEIKDIVDRESLEAWLMGQPKEVSVWIAHRNAMRLLPILRGFVLTTEDEKKGDITALTVLRSNLISSVSYKTPTPSLRDVAIAAFLDAANVDSTAAAGPAAYAAATDADAAAITAEAVDVGAGADFSIWDITRSDCEAITLEVDLDQVKLWGAQENPFTEIWIKVKQQLPTAARSRSGETARGPATVDWSFWIKWYDSVLAGEPLNGEMLKEIALIDAEVWEQGALHINNEVIAGIVEKFRLLREVQDLRKELGPVRQVATAAAMGHNNPPEGIDAAAEAVVVTQIEIIWTALGEAEEELSKPEPSPSVLKRAGTAILGAIKSVLRYAGKLGDVGLKAAAATLGAGAGAYLISKGPEIQSFAEQVIEFAAKYLH